MTPPRPLVIGHRGAPGYRPEHSRAAYELAVRMGVDAVEPDLVVSRDGVLVVRHENEISGTTDVADRPEFADRRTTKTVDGERLTGWFTEDFTWAELSTLRCRERLPRIRPHSAAFDDRQPVLRLADVIDLVAAAAGERPVGLVLEVKHPTYFAALGHDMAALIEAELARARWHGSLVIESFEQTVLAQLRGRGIRASFVYLIDAAGAPADLVAREGDAAATYRDTVSPAGLDALAGEVDGISVHRRLILDPRRAGREPGESVVDDAHARGLQVYTWTCRPENVFLRREYRGKGGASAFGDYEGEWGVIRDAGVDGVFVDHADLGVAFFRG
ncbi:glycerophosphodiester phosphodiesterase [Microbacterium sp. LRZ72]|uniref:glycerophosphodiester phosphodiesterase family protein n=1 Tax=Microbacterium sp. LRZ72 TaxID=2942481 RepID=UPI0029B6A3C5|nr:glycerophosphodiester phosphodiesterase family protein [Microbacterium sp. LRZ72]MDX2377248.1 glycerophosphodiester phosphodiesterase [Microbacterium sp. LRZ72]